MSGSTLALVVAVAVGASVLTAAALTAVSSGVSRRGGPARRWRPPTTDRLLDRHGFLRRAHDVLDVAPGAAVAIVDFGVLSRVVETLGHARGDVAVALVGDRLRAVVADLPARSRVARLDGDTFAVAVAGVGTEAAGPTFERLHARLHAPVVVDGLPFEAAPVLGVTVEDPVDPEAAPDEVGAGPGPRVATLLRRADVALRAARRAGHDVRRYDAGLGERATRRRALIAGFGDALVAGQMRVHYQPLVSLGSRAVVGVEALARWEHPELGSLLPDEFVPVLEASGQIGQLTTFVLGEALGAARRWLDRDLRLSVAVNVSAATVALPAFPERVEAALRTHGVPPELLTLELTESGIAAERDAARPALTFLHALGCHLAVDDFGTGQSSLAHLRRLPIDQVKIDKSFVLGMETERGDSAIVRAIVEMGHTLGMTVVAEGVERPAVRAALTEMGCDVAQGYLVSRPLPVRCLDRWMATLPVATAATGEGGPLTLMA